MQIGEVEFLNGGSKVLPSGATLQVQMDLNSAIFSITNSSSNAVFTAGTTLNAGQLYYMEVRFKETGGGDGASVAVRSDGTVPAITDVISNQNLVFPTAVAPVATPVKVEIYSALASVNPLTGNGGWNAAGARSRTRSR